MAVWGAAVGQILPCHRVGGNINDPYAVTVVKNSDMPIDSDAPVLNEIFTVKTFVNCPESAKFAKVFPRKRFPLYGSSGSRDYEEFSVRFFITMETSTSTNFNHTLSNVCIADHVRAT